MSAAIGGTAEALGGKFANGAVTGAYVMMFNHSLHQIERWRDQKRAPITPIDWNSDEVEYQIAYRLAYARYYGRSHEVLAGELFDMDGSLSFTETWGARGARKGSLSFGIFTLDPTKESVVDQVYFYSPADYRRRSIYLDVSENWFNGFRNVPPYALQLRGSHGRSVSIITIYFNDFNTMMKWRNFILEPWKGL